MIQHGAAVSLARQLCTAMEGVEKKFEEMDVVLFGAQFRKISCTVVEILHDARNRGVASEDFLLAIRDAEKRINSLIEKAKSRLATVGEALNNVGKLRQYSSVVAE